MNRLQTVFLPALAGAALMTACASAGDECGKDFDCGIGSQCSAGACKSKASDQLLTVGQAVGTEDTPNGNQDTPNQLVDAVDFLFGDTTYEGNIGVSTATGQLVTSLTRGDGLLTLRLTRPQALNTFIILYLPDETILDEPGETVLDPADLESGWAQACNYDEDAYDETLPPVTITVPEGDDEGANITVEVAGEGTRGTATIPWRRRL
jgi:hypothetical protein